MITKLCLKDLNIEIEWNRMKWNEITLKNCFLKYNCIQLNSLSSIEIISKKDFLSTIIVKKTWIMSCEDKTNNAWDIQIWHFDH
jgi:hypothetical protein